MRGEREKPEPVPEKVQADVEPPVPVSVDNDGHSDSQEILRVDTDEFTLTVERGNRAEPSPADNYQNTGTMGSTNNSRSGEVTPPAERESDLYATAAEVNTDQKQPVSEPPPVATDKTSSEAAPSKRTAIQPQRVEYVHVVKQGDTLWDISRQYLGNPLHYPELARLSQISDPDWIFPGDVVRIRRK